MDMENKINMELDYMGKEVTEMEGPGKIKIHNDIWYIRYDKNTDEEFNSEDGITFGCTKAPSLEIILRRDMPASILRSTVIHEVSHAYLFSYAIPLSSKHVDAEEVACDFIGSYCDEIIKTSEEIIRMVGNSEIK
jgi:hypothetical protein